MGDDITALEQRENGAQRRIVLADMNHDRQVERFGRRLSPLQDLEIIGPGDISREARLYASDDVAVPGDLPDR